MTTRHSRPRLWIVAGPNGSGKSTFYDSTLIEDFGRAVWIINPDILTQFIVEQEMLELKDANLQAVERIMAWLRASLLTHHTVGVETVLSTDKYRELVKEAKSYGFEIRLIFVMLATPELNIERVSQRVRKGGHNVPEDKIISRFHRSLVQLPWFLEAADRAYVYDNSNRKPLLVLEKGADALAYQPELGPCWFRLGGIPVYKPWALFVWWFHFDAYAPRIFDRAGMIAGASGFLGCGAAVFGSLWRARQRRHVTTYGSARWASPSDIRKAGLLADKGVFLGRLDASYLRHDGPEHVMAFAPTRSGKGVGLVVPTLLGWTGSAVIHDIKGENWQLTAGWRSRFSHCLLFNPTDPRSARYNPLLEVRRGTQEVRDVQNIADILVDPEGALERRNHWEKTSHSLLVGAILHVLYAEENKTLARVATFLSDPQRSFVATLRAMMTTNHLGTAEHPQVHPVVASAARELLNKSENERSGVLSTAMSFLGLYRDPTVAAVTSASDWRIVDLVETKHPVSLYLVVPPSDISRTKPLVRLILNQIGRRLTEELHAEHGSGAVSASRHKLLLMLDEFPALGRLDFFETSLAFLAGYGVRAFLIAQSLNQIEKAYGEHNAILDNCHVRVAFATNDERTAMPWEQPLNQVLLSVEGPVAKIVAVIIIILTGLTLAFGETAGGFRRLIQIIFGLSIAFAASSFFLSFFSFGGGALIA